MRTENVTPISPPCPTCGKKMRLTGVAPTCESVNYDYLCSNDGDRLSWRPSLAGRLTCSPLETRRFPRAMTPLARSAPVQLYWPEIALGSARRSRTNVFNCLDPSAASVGGSLQP